MIVCRAELMAASIAGKISTPLMSADTLLPSWRAGPSSTPIERLNWESLTE